MSTRRTLGALTSSLLGMTLGTGLLGCSHTSKPEVSEINNVSGETESVGQTQDDFCGGGTCNAACTGAACVATNDDGQCIDSKGGISQVCCSNHTDQPCFPTGEGGTIQRAGKRATDGQTGALAATFCIGATQSATVNITSGLPGPGAMILPVQVSVLPKVQ